MTNLECEVCATPLKRSQSRFCSHTCRGVVVSADALRKRKPRDCLSCGREFRPAPRGAKTRTTCSKQCRYALVSARHKAAGTKPPGDDPEKSRARITGANAPWWKGGRYTSDRGYVFVRPGRCFAFPEMVDARGYVREHRMVMALHLGRALERREVVHHANGDRADNRLENLRLHASHSEHMREHHGSK